MLLYYSRFQWRHCTALYAFFVSIYRWEFLSFTEFFYRLFMPNSTRIFTAFLYSILFRLTFYVHLLIWKENPILELKDVRFWSSKSVAKVEIFIKCMCKIVFVENEKMKHKRGRKWEWKFAIKKMTKILKFTYKMWEIHGTSSISDTKDAGMCRGTRRLTTARDDQIIATG